MSHQRTHQTAGEAAAGEQQPAAPVAPDAAKDAADRADRKHDVRYTRPHIYRKITYL